MKYYYIAQAYGSGNYGQNTYTGETTTSVGSSGAGSGSGVSGDLANTGVYVLAIVSLACFLIFLALTVRLMRRKKAVRNMNLPTTIPGRHPIDTPQTTIAPQQQNSQEQKPQPPKRIDF